MYDKNFLIYERKSSNAAYMSRNFQNYNKLGKAGQLLYKAFEVWKPADTQLNSLGLANIQNQNEDYFFTFIEKIYITSQQRTPEQDKYTNSHTRDKAIDFYIQPTYLMPYFAGKLFRTYGNNIYISVDNKHIHFDIDPDKGKGLRYQPSVMIETEVTKKTGQIFPVKSMIDKVIDFYDVGDFTILRSAPGIEKATRKELLDTSPLKPYVGSGESKVAIAIGKKVEENPVLSKIGSILDILEKYHKEIIMAVVTVGILVLAAKYLPASIQEKAIEKMKEAGNLNNL